MFFLTLVFALVSPILLADHFIHIATKKECILLPLLVIGFKNNPNDKILAATVVQSDHVLSDMGESNLLCSQTTHMVLFFYLHVFLKIT